MLRKLGREDRSLALVSAEIQGWRFLQASLSQSSSDLGREDRSLALVSAKIPGLCASHSLPLRLAVEVEAANCNSEQ